MRDRRDGSSRDLEGRIARQADIGIMPYQLSRPSVVLKAAVDVSKTFKFFRCTCVLYTLGELTHMRHHRIDIHGAAGCLTRFIHDRSNPKH
ncbi:hypothetical protein CHELA1G11_20992 [Hyphomicrobiales bacterium]|nr:hypothetical protein CHELA1G11_20992 [Hyphomicrobiales bacterium]